MAKKKVERPMNVRILVPQDVIIPASALPDLAVNVRKRFGFKEGAKVHISDLVAQAVIDGIVDELPDGYEVEDDDYFTDEDLDAYS